MGETRHQSELCRAVVHQYRSGAAGNIVLALFSSPSLSGFLRVLSLSTDVESPSFWVMMSRIQQVTAITLPPCWRATGAQGRGVQEGCSEQNPDEACRRARRSCQCHSILLLGRLVLCVRASHGCGWRLHSEWILSSRGLGSPVVPLLACEMPYSSTFGK